MITGVAIGLIVLAVIGGCATGFFSSVSTGIHKVSNFVENSPMLKNVTDETKEFIKDQAGNAANEISGLFVLQDVLGTKDGGGKGLRVDLEISSAFSAQDAEVRTNQFGYEVEVGDMYVDNGQWIYEIQYEKGVIEDGDFEICVTLLSDGVTECGNGYNGDGKHPENVFISFENYPYPPALGSPRNIPLQDQSQSSANSQSQEQETKIYICNEGGCKTQ